MYQAVGSLLVDVESGEILSERDQNPVDSIEWFDLPKNGDGEPLMTQLLVNALANNTVIQSVSLICDHEGLLDDDGPDGDGSAKIVRFEDFSAFLEVLKGCSKIHYFDLGMDDYGNYLALCQALHAAEHLRSLRVTHDMLDKDSVGPMLDLLTANHAIQSVGCSWGLVDDAALQRLKGILADHPSLGTIAIQDYTVGDVDGLKEMRSEDAITEASMDAFVESLIAHPSMKYVTINSPFSMSDQAVVTVFRNQQKRLCGRPFAFEIDRAMLINAEPDGLDDVLALNRMGSMLRYGLVGIVSDDLVRQQSARVSLKKLLEDPGCEEALIGAQNHAYLTALSQDFTVELGRATARSELNRLETLGYEGMPFAHIDWIKAQLARFEPAPGPASLGLHAESRKRGGGGDTSAPAKVARND